ncbi:MAG: serine/threonine protein kinase [Planctomycetota bacterium]
MSRTSEQTRVSGSSEHSKDARQSTNVDTLLGRIVVEQGLATSEEVQLCFEQQRQRVQESPERSLAELMVENSFITNRQLERIRREVEAQKSTQQIPGYSIKKKLGAGAMASVYLARQISLDRLVAIKVLPKRYSSNPQFIERFYQEGRAAARLNHPNIVQAYDVGKAGEYHYFVMEYVDGNTVFDVINDRGKFSEKDAIDVVLQMADALQHAHEHGFVHRDVKPKNIMFTKGGTSKLADMGLARELSDREAAEAEAGRAFGTPYYISPEQIRGEVNIGPQADIYSLGATFYHMLTGRVPFEGENPSSVMHKHLKADLVPPDHVNSDLSAGVAQVVEMMMARSRKKRYHNCKDVIADLREVREGRPPTLAGSSELDLSGLATGSDYAVVEGEGGLDDTMVTASPRETYASIFNHPAFLIIALLFVISVIGNIVLVVTLSSQGS